jgi:CheY-like chemotaxis protein
LARKILLADDSVTAQNMGRKILADAGYEVIAVNNGSAALKKIAELKPDLVILDVYMPGYSGLEVCQRLKESQETARIPVLLSVGKLEPFKPEEAQRVRADGFIVKPFEASELLSALSKLEDKVVPRAEPSKPGRFARAMAAAEESDRGGRSATAKEESGWKSRIGFPKQKTETEQNGADESPIYNAMNRDLRTVVDKPTPAKEASRQPAAEAPETSVDVAALVPPSLPNDVTPEEVAAIAAAVAQMQMATAASHDVENVISETQLTENRRPETKSETNFEPTPGPIGDNRAPQSEIRYASTTPAQVEAHGDASVTAVETAPATFTERENDVPVTMAATGESVVTASAGASCWMAVPVALDSQDASISLDQEMQKGYAAFVAAGADPAGFAAIPEVQAARDEDSSARAEAVVAAPVTTISNPEPEPVPEPALAMNTEASGAGSVPVAQSETSSVASSFVDTVPAPLPEPLGTSSEPAGDRVAESRTAEVEPKSEVEISPAAELSEPHHEPATPTEFVSPAVETEVADPGAFAAQMLQPAPEAEPAAAEAAASSVASTLIVSTEEQAVQTKLDPETVKSTAAAWATWRQIRDSGDAKSDAAAEAAPSEFEVPASAPTDSAAMAVAAGAEQISQEASAAPDEKPHDVASIVDSVLADLRPKLMAEISRKMAEKK